MKKLSLFLSVPMLSIPFVAISCSNENQDFFDNLNLNSTFVVEKDKIEEVGKIFDSTIETEEIINFETKEKRIVSKSLWEKFSAVDGKITRIFDGDTVEVVIENKLVESNNAFNVGDKVKVRIPLIDTLEQNVKDVTEREKKLSHIDTEYVHNVLKPGTKVRLISDNWTDGSYDRKIAYLFFGEGFKKNFSIDMLANGWTLPRINNNDLIAFISDFNNVDKSSVKSYLLPFVARAFNHGYINKKGFYVNEGVNITLNNKQINIKFNLPMDLAKEYIAHGSTLMSDAYQFLYPFNIEKKNRPKFGNPKNNIYEFLKSIKQK
ncbi:thermonuclease family protein [Mycoplasmopsis arginini]|uniref:TNase-like domain-containing protein n=1 Tax=Mycoplasmopsis arginini TaxID=2094 RepID=A0AA43U2Y7_MYCAR|nr:hypothetical protein [Mycoplasmopsis arginini]MCY2903024.1 thermonuclease family protein [Mycoplasmopsis arginini QMP CG1-2758]MDI3349734.1 hypothetical protein [Mycoplasmopsis arginini]MDI3350398.1 hypothetical protein [Mycoplasmopsis arginini]MDI3350791.1 hypothetical protein [Mycoplasmopsis arginini]MDI3351458.1 hypothetical protein [Mycoplasmopsis arginini]